MRERKNLLERERGKMLYKIKNVEIDKKMILVTSPHKCMYKTSFY